MSRPRRQLQVTLDLRDSRGRRLSDTATFRLLTNGSLAGRFRDVAFDGRPVRLSALIGIDPPNPEIEVSIRSRLFRGLRTESIRLRRIPREPVRVVLARHPDEFRPEFTAWDALPGSLARLKRVLEGSPDVGVIGAKPISGTFTGRTYDARRGRTYTFAKATLLNLYGKMEATRPPASIARSSWFSYVRRILRLGRERIIALVDDDMFQDVARAAKSAGYAGSGTAAHEKNVPKRYRIEKMTTAKTIERYKLANLQLTVARVRDAGGARVTLLDADIDEHQDPIRHFVDAHFIHPFTGGTHPYEVHDFLGFALGRRDLGYELVPARRR